jgi:hypothetical protein
MNKEVERMYCEAAMRWYGWGSPIGLSIFFLSLGISACLVRYAILG